QLKSYNSCELKAFTRQNNIVLTPTITSFEEDNLRSSIKDEETTNKLITNIVSEVVNNNWAGIDLDFESAYADDKEKLFTFLKKLQSELTKEDKKLTFTAIPKGGNKVLYTAFPATRFVQDYAKIGEIVDEFRTMTYD